MICEGHTCGHKSQGGLCVGHFSRPVVVPDRASRRSVHGGCECRGRSQAGPQRRTNPCRCSSLSDARESHRRARIHADEEYDCQKENRSFGRNLSCPAQPNGLQIRDCCSKRETVAAKSEGGSAYECCGRMRNFAWPGYGNGKGREWPSARFSWRSFLASKECERRGARWCEFAGQLLRVVCFACAGADGVPGHLWGLASCQPLERGLNTPCRWRESKFGVWRFRLQGHLI